MYFPESERVIYSRNPLKEVVCQIRFPPILRIESELPAAFQERVRPVYSDYEQKRQMPPIDVPPEVLRGLAQAQPIIHEFKAQDGEWAVAVTKDFLALTTSAYERWERFSERLQFVRQAFEEIYQPADYLRIGLRYRDVLRRSALGFDEAQPWTDVLQPWIAGELGDDRISQSRIEARFGEVHIDLGDGNSVRFRHGIAEEEGIPEPAYMIDADFFRQERTGADDVNRLLDYYHEEAGRAFRWAITDATHDALEPRSV